MVKIIVMVAAVVALVNAAPSNRQSGSIDVLCDSLLQSLAGKTISRLAVLPFTTNELPENSQSGKAIAEYLVIRLNSSGKIKVVDRIDFQKMLQEISLSETDIVDESTVLKVGKVLAADAILTGTIAEVLGNKQITAKVIRTETGEVIGGAAMVLPLNRYTQLASELVAEKSRVSSVMFRSLLAPGWGQFYTEHPVRGSISSVAALASLAYLGYRCAYVAGTTTDLAAHKESSNGTTWQGRWEQYDARLRTLEEDNREASDRMITAGVITGSVWVLNLIDAWVAGAETRQRIETYFSFTMQGSAHAGIVMHW